MILQFDETGNPGKILSKTLKIIIHPIPQIIQETKG